MKNRTTDKGNTVVSTHDHFSKSTPNSKDVINELLTGVPIHHTDWTKSHEGEQHRLGVTIHKLRHKYGFDDLIQCPKHSSHPLRHHYFIASKDIDEARDIALKNGLLKGERE